VGFRDGSEICQVWEIGTDQSHPERFGFSRWRSWESLDEKPFFPFGGSEGDEAEMDIEDLAGS